MVFPNQRELKEIRSYVREAQNTRDLTVELPSLTFLRELEALTKVENCRLLAYMYAKESLEILESLKK